jgi:undecaprenyl diphosphate synthase
MARKKKVKLPKTIPTHIAIIMDGNGRWARSRGLPRNAGHRAGVENLRPVLEACGEFGIRFLTVYAFSTENWERPADEVQGLMNILEDVIDRELNELHENGVQLRHLGHLERLRPALQEKVLHAIDLTKDNTRISLNIAWNYGGRDELVRAIRKLIEDSVPAQDITEALVGEYLYTAGCPDPDMIIRTAGDQRVSNFLLWQGAYAELYVTPTYWPDFGREELLDALHEYASRERRFGRVPGPVTPS